MAREREFPDDTKDERQQKTLSLRISDVLHERLERVRDALSVRAGSRATISEVAKQLLESADEKRLELVELLKKPTDALLAIKEKHAQGLKLSKNEWTCIAYYVHRSLEWTGSGRTNIQPESFVAVVKAFLAVYRILPKPDSEHRDYYIGNLAERTSIGDGPLTDDAVSKAAAKCIHFIETAKKPYQPIYVGRNLYSVLESERITNLAALNEALVPFWTPLWRLAARGHFRVMGVPLRPPRSIGDEHYEGESFLPPVYEEVPGGNFSLSFLTLDGTDLSVLLTFPGRRGVMYPLSRFPEVAAFRSMLFGLAADREGQRWDSDHFFAYTSRNDDGIDVSFRSKENGITFGFSPESWLSLKSLFTKAWNTPEVSRNWNKLIEEYGEL